MTTERDHVWEAQLSALGTRAWCFPRSDSTMDLARGMSSELSNGIHGVVLSRMQMQGRGRQGKPWLPPASGFFATYIFVTERSAEFLAGFSLAVGVAVARALESLGAEASLKWPNDVLLNDRKVAGILIESASVLEPSRLVRTTVLTGIGINLAGEPPEMPESTSVATAIGRNISQEEMASVLTPLMQEMWSEFLREGFVAFRREFLGRAAFLDRTITLMRGGDQEQGVFCGVDDSGALQFSIDGTVFSRTSGEVSMVRPTP